MPEIAMIRDVHASTDLAWQVLLEVQRYPEIIDTVIDVEIIEDRPASSSRLAKWAVELRGSILRWIEEEVIDESNLRVDFHQTEGDLAYINGHWRVEAIDANTSRMYLNISFDIGIPLMAEMLNPVAEQALLDNGEIMLAAIAERSVAGVAE